MARTIFVVICIISGMALVSGKDKCDYILVFVECQPSGRLNKLNKEEDVKAFDPKSGKLDKPCQTQMAKCLQNDRKLNFKDMMIEYINLELFFNSESTFRVWTLLRSTFEFQLSMSFFLLVGACVSYRSACLYC